MDIDLDSDKKQEFLVNKLEELKLANQQLEKSLHERHEISSKYGSDENVPIFKEKIKIEQIWKRDALFGYIIINETEVCLEVDALHVDNLIISWGIISLKTKHPVLDEGLVYTKKINERGLLLIKCDFFEYPTIKGEIIFRSENIRVTITLPTLDGSFSIPKAIADDVLELLSIALKGTEIFPLVLMPPNRRDILPLTLFTSYCNFTKVNIPSKREFFMSADFLLEIIDRKENNSVHFKAYCSFIRAKELIHYLYTKIQGASVVPSSHYPPYGKMQEYQTLKIIRKYWENNLMIKNQNNSVKFSV